MSLELMLHQLLLMQLTVQTKSIFNIWGMIASLVRWLVNLLLLCNLEVDDSKACFHNFAKML